MNDLWMSKKAFWKWLIDNGTLISPKIAIHNYSDINAGRGIIATLDIHKDEVLFRLPRSLILSVRESKYRKFIERIDVDGWKPLMLAIVRERFNKASKWKPYFDILPADFGHMPMLWKKEELQFLKGTSLLEKFGDPVEDFNNNFKLYLEKLKSFKGQDLFDLYNYAGSLISSYSFTGDTTDEVIMVPLADLFNHRTGQTNVRLVFGNDYLEMICIKNCAAGGELINTYGYHGNSELLFRYGFIEEDNKYNCLHIDLDLFISQTNLSQSKIEEKLDTVQEYLDQVLDSENEDFQNCSEKIESRELEIVFDREGKLKPHSVYLVNSLVGRNGSISTVKVRKESKIILASLLYDQLLRFPITCINTDMLKKRIQQTSGKQKIGLQIQFEELTIIQNALRNLQ